MITRVELTNFMSHRHTVIEPAAGLTVLVGPNNVGKSAVVAALQILCHNENSTYVQRHGERDCSVRVHTDDGHVIEWRRKTAPSYIIDGQVFDRLKGNGLPDELCSALRLTKVDAGGDADFDVHFGTQKSPIFLLGNSAANAARFFASSSDAIRLVSIQKRHRGDAARDGAEAATGPAGRARGAGFSVFDVELPAGVSPIRAA
jgi:exonuclease SbcC